MAVQFHFPPELILAICAFVRSSGFPAPAPSLDPLVLSAGNGSPTTSSPSAPAESWSEPIARLTLANLCLVNHAWYAGAKPWLWRKVEVRLPRTWLNIVEEVVGCVDDKLSAEQAAFSMEDSVNAAVDAALASRVVTGYPASSQAALEARVLEELSKPDSPIPRELFSSSVPGDSSHRQLRSDIRSADRWRILKAIQNVLQNIFQRDEPGVYSEFDFASRRLAL